MDAVAARRLLVALLLIGSLLAGAAIVWLRQSDEQAPALPSGPAPSLQAELAGARRVLAAGDIARCDNGWDEWTARSVEGSAGTVLALGDLAYPHGSAADFRDCYDPSWGRFRDRTWPVPGNHEYDTPGARGYREYFGARVTTDGEPWYTFELGGWRLYALDSNCLVAEECDAEAQLAWLQEELATGGTGCALAYWHHPRFSSGRHGDEVRVDPLWRTVVEGGVDIILNGHDHLYERFRTMDGEAQPSEGGTRSFVVGTGGGALTGVRDVKPTSEYREPSRFGVLTLELRDGSYDWRFVPTATWEGDSDAGSGTCG